jgi:hypothetical protein
MPAPDNSNKITFHRRGEEEVIELLKGDRTDYSTTRDYFTRSEYDTVAKNVDTLKKNNGVALQRFINGKNLDAADKAIIEKTFGSNYADQREAVKAVYDWRLKNQHPPTNILRVDNRPILSNDVKIAANALKEVQNTNPDALDAFKKVADGRSSELQKPMLQALEKAGLINNTGEISVVGKILANPTHGTEYLVNAGLVTKPAPLPQSFHTVTADPGRQHVGGTRLTRDDIFREVRPSPHTPHYQPPLATPSAATPYAPSASTAELISPDVRPPATTVPAVASAEQKLAAATARSANATSKALKIGTGAAPAVLGGVLAGGAALANGQGKYAALKAAGHGAVDGALGISDAKIAMDPKQRPADRFLGGLRAATATTATGAAIATAVAPNPVTATTAAVAGTANLVLGVAQDVAHWTGLANNPGTIEQSAQLLGQLNHFLDPDPKANGQSLVAFTNALTHGNKAEAAHQLAEYKHYVKEQHRMGRLSNRPEDRYSTDPNINGQKTFDAANNLADKLYKDAEKRNFQPEKPHSIAQQSAPVQQQTKTQPMRRQSLSM